MSYTVHLSLNGKLCGLHRWHCREVQVTTASRPFRSGLYANSISFRLPLGVSRLTSGSGRGSAGNSRVLPARARHVTQVSPLPAAETDGAVGGGCSDGEPVWHGPGRERGPQSGTARRGGPLRTLGCVSPGVRLSLSVRCETRPSAGGRSGVASLPDARQPGGDERRQGQAIQQLAGQQQSQGRAPDSQPGPLREPGSWQSPGNVLVKGWFR